MLQVPSWGLRLGGEIIERQDLPMLKPAWQELCERSVEDNVYYTPRYAEALLDSVEAGRKVSFAAVWDGVRLVALLPFTRPALALPLLQAHGRAWQTPYTFSCTPLLDRTDPVSAAGALVDVLASARAGEWVLPTLNTSGLACRSLLTALGQKGLPYALANSFQRATLEAGPSFDDHMARHVDPKRRKDLARNLRNLEKLGKVAVRTYTAGEALDKAVAAFLAIEGLGWKGARGTALACRDDTRRFALSAFTGDAANSICRADVLTLDETPIAVSLIVRAGDTGFAVKCCYDETYRKYSAGLLLEVEVIRSFLSEKWARRLDAGTAGAHVIDCLWPGRVEVADLTFSLAERRPEMRVAAVQKTADLRRRAKAGLKQRLESLRSG